jgi:hypothetical protein
MRLDWYISSRVGADLDPLGISNYTQPFQFCGGYLSPTDFTPQPYITAEGVPSTESSKGYLCPVGSMCIVLSTWMINLTILGSLQSLQRDSEFR